MAPFEMLPAAYRIVQGIMGAQAGERVLVVTDTRRPHSVTAALCEAAALCAAEQFT